MATCPHCGKPGYIAYLSRKGDGVRCSFCGYDKKVIFPQGLTTTELLKAMTEAEKS